MMSPLIGQRQPINLKQILIGIFLKTMKSLGQADISCRFMTTCVDLILRLHYLIVMPVKL